MVMPWVGAGKGSPKLGIAAVDPRIQSSPSKRMLMSGSVMVDPGEAGMSSGMVLVCAGIVVRAPGRWDPCGSIRGSLAVSREHRPAGW
ncbi:hypothetical protein DSJ90_06820 [Mycobacterium tuberculosis]|nr:hypothetical protein DSJ90_06820 [Mycobacterium tuberculosis]